MTKLFDRKQTTCETCLATCLITLLKEKSINVKNNEEINILGKGLEMTRMDYTIGQLEYVVKKYGVRIKCFVENTVLYNELVRLRFPSKLSLENMKIDKKFIVKLVQEAKLPIVYTDMWYLKVKHHYPHFVAVRTLKDRNNKVEIFDPWFGKEMLMSTKTLIESVQSLRNHLKLSPKLILVE